MVRAPVQGFRTTTIKEQNMARKPKEKVNGVVNTPDFDLAKRIYDHDIAPANRAQKQAMSEASAGWKEVRGEAHVHVGGFRTAAKVANMEEADQQMWLRSFREGLTKFGIGLHRDLVDAAEGADDETPVVPVMQAKPVELPVLQ
jgi:hypothetical protein